MKLYKLDYSRGFRVTESITTHVSPAGLRTHRRDSVTDVSVDYALYGPRYGFNYLAHLV